MYGYELYVSKPIKYFELELELSSPFSFSLTQIPY